MSLPRSVSALTVTLRTTILLASILLTVALTFAAADDVTPHRSPATPEKLAPRETTVQRLRSLAILVGDWKGVGQPKRGSNVGAWSEKAAGAWKFEGDSASLILTFEPGKQFHSATFILAADAEQPQLILSPIMGEPVLLTQVTNVGDSTSAENTFIFESSESHHPQTRCTIRTISDIRVTLLFEEKPTDKGSWRRLAELGLTRAGAKLASGNAGERQCIVTGGLGTIKVTHEGKTYFVCCEGCQQAFEADPEGTLQAYRDRLKK